MESWAHFIEEFFTSPFFTVAVGISAVVATAVYLFGFSGVLRKELKRRRMEHAIKTLKDHYILCGFGRVGQQVAKELASEDQPFVIIEREESKTKLAKENNWPVIMGDVALDEAYLTQAGIDKAKCIIISVGTDADAIFMAVSARALNHDIFIVARASSKEAADKLAKIGVNRIALPYQIGGYHMATMALRPAVVDFLNVLVDNDREELEMEEFFVSSGGHYDGKTLEEGKIFTKNVVVVAVRKKDGKTVVNPAENYKMAANDRLIVMGGKDQLVQLGKEFDKNQPKEKTKEEHEVKESAAVIVDGSTPDPFMKEE